MRPTISSREPPLLTTNGNADTNNLTPEEEGGAI